MAEGFEAYHVPQQSRRDKLRVVAQNHPDNLQGFLPPYDPSFLSPDLVAHGHGQTFHHHLPLSAGDFSTKPIIKQEGATLMGFLGGFVTGSSSYSDPSSSLATNSIPGINIEQPFYCTPQGLQNIREFTQSYNSGDLVVFKPEPPLNHDSSATNQVLSLSLSSHRNNHSLELNSQKYVPSLQGENVAAAGYVDKDVTRSPVPLGPFTGYASILKGSRFLKPAQQLLEEFCNGGREIYVEKVTADSSLMDCSMESYSAAVIGDDSGVEQRRKKSTLLSMLEEVYRRYRQYYQQMHAAVSSFEYVGGLSNAAPYANLALKTMSKHFRTLKNAITDQLQFAGNVHGHMIREKDESSRLANINRGTPSHRFFENQPVWRPQRGLPERAVTVLKAWLFEHFLHPYPTDTDKMMLAKQTGLSRNQVSNWFINARVRLWKPMVEEIHMLETRQGQRASQREEQNMNRQNDIATAKSLACENPSTSDQIMHGIPSKGTQNEFPDMPVGNGEPLSHSYNGMSSHHGGGGMNIAGGGGGVSLTLGLHQNDGIGLTEPFPVNAAQRFGVGIDANDDQGFVMGGFEIQSRHTGRDVIGGQLFHDFVG